MNILIRQTEEIVSERQFYAMYPNIAFPKPLSSETLDSFDAEWAEQAVGVSLEQAKQSLKDTLTDIRWQVETGGIEVAPGLWIDTALDSFSKVDQILNRAEEFGITTFDFKSASGWMTMTVAQMRPIAREMALHRQACFAAERAHHEAVDALLDLDDVTAYDSTVGWPPAQKF